MGARRAVWTHSATHVVSSGSKFSGSLWQVRVVSEVGKLIGTRRVSGGSKVPPGDSRGSVFFSGSIQVSGLMRSAFYRISDGRLS